MLRYPPNHYDIRIARRRRPEVDKWLTQFVIGRASQIKTWKLAQVLVAGRIGRTFRFAAF